MSNFFSLNFDPIKNPSEGFVPTMKRPSLQEELKGFLKNPYTKVVVTTYISEPFGRYDLSSTGGSA